MGKFLFHKSEDDFPNEIAALSFEPDYRHFWTAKEFKDNYTGGDIKFKGPGWYFGKVTILVIPVTRTIDRLWNQSDQEIDEVYDFLFYDHPNQGSSFELITDAPVRIDNR